MRFRDTRLPIRFWVKARRIKKSGCWLWQGAATRNGYGQFRFGGRTWLAHRLVYRVSVGTIPEGLDLDHLCRNRACCNPAHLEAVTRQENVNRGARGTANVTRCLRGHAFDEENTHVLPSGWRRCRKCHAARERQRYQEAVGAA